MNTNLTLFAIYFFPIRWNWITHHWVFNSSSQSYCGLPSFVSCCLSSLNSLKLLLKCLDACCWFLHLWIVILLLYLFRCSPTFFFFVPPQPSCVTVEQSCSVCKCCGIRSCCDVLISLFFAFFSHKLFGTFWKKIKKTYCVLIFCIFCKSKALMGMPYDSWSKYYDYSILKNMCTLLSQSKSMHKPLLMQFLCSRLLPMEINLYVESPLPHLSGCFCLHLLGNNHTAHCARFLISDDPVRGEGWDIDSVN